MTAIKLVGSWFHNAESQEACITILHDKVQNYVQNYCCSYCSLYNNQIGGAGAQAIAEGCKLCPNLQSIK